MSATDAFVQSSQDFVYLAARPLQQLIFWTQKDAENFVRSLGSTTDFVVQKHPIFGSKPS